VAIFNFESDNQNLDWALFQNSPIHLYFQNEILEKDLAWLRANRYQIFSFDCSDWESEEDFHKEAARTLRFPDYYGGNLNAFNDCLGDMNIPETGGTIIVFVRFDLFAGRFRDAAQGILEMIAINSRRYSLEGKRLLGLAQSDNPRISFNPVGACPVIWNPKEWLDENRKPKVE
jgi:RNAse (barnase) inhibitor barstar